MFRFEVATAGGGYGFVDSFDQLLEDVEREYAASVRKEVEEWALSSNEGSTFKKYSMFIENIGEQEQCSIRRVNEKSKVERCVKKAETMKLLKEYAKKFGIREVIDDYGKHRRTREHSIVFPNGWVASIAAYGHPEKGKYSVAMCDYNGYFDWSILNSYGADNGVLFCNTELEIIIACETIRRL